MSFKKQYFLCNLCQQSSMYEDLKNNIDFIIKNKKCELNNDEKNFMIICYKNLINKYRESIIFLNEKLLNEKNNIYKEYITEYKNKLILQLFEFINGLIVNLNKLVQNSKEKENRILYYKLIGDYYRYICEYYDEEIFNEKKKSKKENNNEEKKQNSDNNNINNENKSENIIKNKESTNSINENNNLNNNKENNNEEKYIKLAIENYEKSINLCDEISYKNSLKLELLLNISVFYYEILQDKEMAITISKETLDNAKIAFRDIDEENEEYKISINIINILSENLEIWSKEDNFEFYHSNFYKLN